MDWPTVPIPDLTVKLVFAGRRKWFDFGLVDISRRNPWGKGWRRIAHVRVRSTEARVVHHVIRPVIGVRAAAAGVGRVRGSGQLFTQASGEMPFDCIKSLQMNSWNTRALNVFGQLSKFALRDSSRALLMASPICSGPCPA